MSGDDWFVPGAFVDTGERKIRLHPPPDWRRDVIEIPRVPPSMNSNKIRSHWRGFHTEKKSWQEEIGLLLMEARLPRGNQRAIAGVIMRFQVATVAGRVRDPGNYSQLVNKALGDALVIADHTPVAMRYIPDDDGPHYLFGGVEFEEELGPPRTLIHLYTQPATGEPPGPCMVEPPGGSRTSRPRARDRRT